MSGTGRAKQALVRELKALRDGPASIEECVGRIAALRRQLKFKGVSQACAAVQRGIWTQTVIAGTEEQIASLVGAIIRRPPRSAALADSRRLASLTATEPTERAKETPTVIRQQPAHVGPVHVRHFEIIGKEEVLQAHWALVQYFRRSRDPVEPPGLKDDNLLESALSRQGTSIDGIPKYRTLPQLAAALVFGLTLNHPFHNGNKRTAFLALLLLLDRNDYVLIATEREAVTFMVDVASHKFRSQALGSASLQMDDETREIARWISAHCRRVDHRLKPIDWRDLRRRLREFDATDRVLKGNFIEIERGEKRITLAYPGDTREVGKPTIRQIWRELGLDESKSFDASAFYGSGEKVGKFIEDYLEVFRDLAHT